MRVIGWLLLGLLAIFAAYCLLLAVSALLVSTKKEYRHDSPFYRWAAGQLHPAGRPHSSHPCGRPGIGAASAGYAGLFRGQSPLEF